MRHRLFSVTLNGVTWQQWGPSLDAVRDMQSVGPAAIIVEIALKYDLKGNARCGGVTNG